MQKCESRTKRVMSAIIAGMMALQVVAPTISYADDTVASTASSEDNSDTQIDPGVPVQTDTASSNTVTEPDSSESLEETADSEQTGEIQDDTVSEERNKYTRRDSAGYSSAERFRLGNNRKRIRSNRNCNAQ